MGLKANKLALRGFSDKLVAGNVLEQQAANDAVQAAIEQKQSFTAYLIEKQLATPKQIAVASAEHFALPLLDLDVLDEETVSKDLVSEKLIEKHRVLPIYQRENNLYIAVSDPANMPAVYEIKFHTGLNTHVVLVEEDKLTTRIEKFLQEQDHSALGDLEDSSLDFTDTISDDELEEEDDSSDTGVDDAPIVRFVNKILLDAIKRGASDIHFEPYEKTFRVRFRIDGILYEMANPPVNLANKIAARIKVMSNLDISERRIPQDGRFKLKLSRKNVIDFRVNTCPTTGGEKIVARILDPSSAKVGIDKLGYEDFQKEIFLESINMPQGMVLVTGPTGSGKTVSLYTALNILNNTERNVSTVEDPVEINLPGVNQVNINTKAGLGFSDALRAFLRQDPDVIMVGEIRDLETAEIAIKAAQTGHLVLSTLHTNSTPETLGRLINMGVPAYNLATSINLIIAQRLARRLCTECKNELAIPEHALLEQGFTEESLEQAKLYGPRKIYGPSSQSCDKCTDGYSGRVGIYEVLKISTEIGRIIMDGGNAIDILEQAKKEGLQTLRASGLQKVLQGITSLEEINRVTKD